MESQRIDLDRVCRTCKNDSAEMKSLFARDSESGKENPRLDEMLMACASVQVNEEDGLPKLICRLCYVQLKSAYLFKRQCETTNVYLKNYAECLRRNSIKEESLLVDANVPDNFINEIESEVEGVKDDPEIDTEDFVDEDNSDYKQLLDENTTAFQCTTCSKEFCTFEGLRNHKRTHAGNTYNCKQCNKSYIRLDHLYRHQLIHTRNVVHICKICDKTLIRSERLKRHLMTHLKEKPYGCSTCNRVFCQPENLENHAKTCKGETVYPCDICNKVLSREESLEVHRRVHKNKFPVLPTLEDMYNPLEFYTTIDCDDMTSSDKLGEDSEEDWDDVEDTIEPKVEIHEEGEQEKINEIEKKSYEEDVSDDLLLEKVIVEEFYTNENDGISSGSNENDCNSDATAHTQYKSKENLRKRRGRPRKQHGKHRSQQKLQHKMETSEFNYSCPECDTAFASIAMLERHAEQHKPGIKLYECDKCSEKFSRSSSLKRHKLEHSKGKQFPCTKCNRSFLRREHLKRHIVVHSSGKDTHKCDICLAIFHRPHNLAKHKAFKHNVCDETSELGKKYKCELCQKVFTSEKYRDSHMKSHLGERKYRCKTCGKAFIWKSHLSEHMKFHNENSKKYLCSECGQRFVRNDYLIIHMRRHRGEKPFKCKFCGRGFPRTTDLTVHERYHTGEKTHLCVVCGRGFGRAYNLTVHMRTHTGEKPYQCTYCEAAFAQGNDLKAHIRRHTGERFHCDLCSETFLMGYALTQHKRAVHGLNIVTNIRRLQSVNANPDDPPPILVSLPAPVIVPTPITEKTEDVLDVKVPMIDGVNKWEPFDD